MKSHEYTDKLRHLEWLRGIVKDYEDTLRFLERVGNEITFTSIKYDHHGPGSINLNNHRSIKMPFIFFGIENALSKVKDEIASIEEELKSVTVEL